MVKNPFEIITSIQSSVEESHSLHITLQDMLEKSLLNSHPSSTNIQIDLSTIEEIAVKINNLLKNDFKIQSALSLCNSIKDFFPAVLEIFQLLKVDLNVMKSSIESDISIFNKLLAQMQSIHKEFKLRVQTGFLDYLKGLDIDLRKILKPLVPSSVITEQVKFPLITTHSSLRSSVHSIPDSFEDPQEESSKSQPEPAEVTIQKLNSHIQMLVGSLENLAKDLLQILAENNREYYQLLNKQDVYSRPQTPLAAPLPDYFCYELQETPKLALKPMLSSESKEKWIKRLNTLKDKQGINDVLYRSLMGKLAHASEKKLDLKELFVGNEVSVTEREGLVYYLLNGSTEFEKHVSLSEILNEDKVKPEPPKVVKSKGRVFHKVEKESDKRFSPLNPDQEVARISQASPVQPQARVMNSIRMISKSPKIDRLLKNRKSVRVRSITPVGKEKSGQNNKPRTPSVQNNKVSLNTLNAKHRLRRNL